MLGALIFSLATWELGFPTSNWDDLFYNGAALNMAGGGDFSNPLLARQDFPSHYFFVYPPLHSYAVYGWVSLWGVSAASLLALQNLLYFIIAWMMIILLRRQEAPELFSWLAPWGVAAVFMKTGLRPEILAVALAMSGYVILIHSRKTGFCLWLAFWLMFLGATTAPRMSLFAATLALVGGWQWMNSTPAKGSRWLRFGAVAGLAAGATMLIFLILIGFHISEFTQTFRLHATRLTVVDGRWVQFVNFMQGAFMGARWWPIFFLTSLLLCFAARFPADNPTRLCYWLAATCVVAGLTNSLGAGSSWCVMFILLLLAAVLVKKISRPPALALQLAIVLLLLVANSTKLLEAFGILTGKIDTQPPPNRAAILAMRSTKEHPLLVDVNVGRYVFDYKLPPGVVDFAFAARFPGVDATTTKLREEDTFVIGPNFVELLDMRRHTHHPVETWNVLGFKNWTYYRHPQQAFIIPARECMDLSAGK